MREREIIAQGAERLAANDWRAGWPSMGWLVGVTFTGNAGEEYAARKAFADWWAPAEHRNDGMRISETATEKGMRMGRARTVAAMRAFADGAQQEPSLADLQQWAIDADSLFSAALMTRYGRRAGDMRYSRNLPADLAALADEHVLANEARHLAYLEAAGIKD